MNERAKVFVVDDDPAVLQSVEALLSHRGYELRCYASPEKFLDEAPLDTPGCVISDIQMPDFNGVELLRKLVASNSLLSVVVVTGVADVPTAVMLMESGAVTLLEKPYDQGDLLDAVERAVATSQQRWQLHQREHEMRQRLDSLTDEERRVMELVLAGEPNKAIARVLKLSMRTVDRRRHAILDKMRANSIPELALMVGGTRRTSENDIETN